MVKKVPKSDGPFNRNKRLDVSKEAIDAGICTKQGEPKRRGNQFPNTRCIPERFCEIVSLMNEQQKGWVREMGFGDLLKLTVKKIDRYLCLWLMRRFDPEERRLLVRDNYSVAIGANDVGWVLGLPGPNATVPTDISVELLGQYKARFSNENGIDERATYEKLIGYKGSERDFKELFLLYTLGALLCPTQSARISPMHLKVLPISVEANKYNWCDYVFEWLVVSARRFQRSRSKAGGYGGCALFLMVFYLDRLDIGNPMNWSITTSRVDAWTQQKCRDVIKKDRKSVMEFGGAKFVSNVIYGEHYPIGTHKIRWEEVRKRKRKESNEEGTKD